MDFDDIAWTGVEFEVDGGPVLLRFRQFPNEFAREEFPERLNIFWTLRQPSESGMPSSTELQEQQVFEDRLVEAVESDHHSVMSLVMLGKNQKEFVFHTSSPQEFIQRLNDMPQEDDPYPIKIHHNPDPSWDYPDDVIADIVSNKSEQDAPSNGGQRPSLDSGFPSRRG